MVSKFYNHECIVCRAFTYPYRPEPAVLDKLPGLRKLAEEASIQNLPGRSKEKAQPFFLNHVTGAGVRNLAFYAIVS